METSPSSLGQQGRSHKVDRKAACISCHFCIKQSPGKEPGKLKPLTRQSFCVNFVLCATWWHLINRNSEYFFSFSMNLTVEMLIWVVRSMYLLLSKWPLHTAKGFYNFSDKVSLNFLF